MNPENRFTSALTEFRTRRSVLSARLGRGELDRKLDSTDIHNAVVELDRARRGTWQPTLTYYCRAEVAESLIDGGSLWLTDVRKMNDLSELNFATEYLLGTALKAAATNAQLPGLITVIRESLERWVSQQSDWKDTRAYNERLVLAMCLSEHQDDFLMWQQYGDQGFGASIQFDTTAMHRAVRSASVFNPGGIASEMNLVKVCYPTEPCTCLPDLILDADAAYTEVASDRERDLLRNLIDAEALRLLMGHKDPRFAGEGEVRIFARALAEKTWSGSDTINWFERGAGGFHYMTLHLPNQARGSSPQEFLARLVKSVTLGPCTSESTREKLHSALAGWEISSRLRKSDVPMRCPHRSSP